MQPCSRSSVKTICIRSLPPLARYLDLRAGLGLQILTEIVGSSSARRAAFEMMAPIGLFLTTHGSYLEVHFLTLLVVDGTLRASTIRRAYGCGMTAPRSSLAGMDRSRLDLFVAHAKKVPNTSLTNTNSGTTSLSLVKSLARMSQQSRHAVAMATAVMTCPRTSRTPASAAPTRR